MPWLRMRPPGLTRRATWLRVYVDLVGAHVLDHADARDRVEGLVGQLAVVGHADVDLVAQPQLHGAALADLGLGRGQRDADHLHAVAGRGVGGEAAPAAADVEHALTRLQSELGADHLQLRLLRLLERRRAAREDRAAVGHRGAEEELGRTRAAGRSDGAPSGRRARGCGACRAGAAPPAGGRGGSRRPVARAAASASRARADAVQRRRLPGVEQVEHRVHVVDLELARYVRATQAELPRGAQRVRERRRRAHREARPAAVGRGQLRAVPEVDRERPLGEGAVLSSSRMGSVVESKRRRYRNALENPARKGISESCEWGRRAACLCRDRGARGVARRPPPTTWRWATPTPPAR